MKGAIIATEPELDMRSNNGTGVRSVLPTMNIMSVVFFFSSRRRHTRLQGDWSSDVCSSDLRQPEPARHPFFFADLERAYGFDPERARSIIGSAMTEAGATFDGTWRWQGNPGGGRLIQGGEGGPFDLPGDGATQLEAAGFSGRILPD